MRIEDPGAADEVAAFRTRIEKRLAEHGALGGVSLGEAFKLMPHL